MDHPAVLAACQQFRLNRALPQYRGQGGTHLGAGTGASVEFQEFRPYVMGDDPRRVDWAAYARTRQLTVRLYREEISPHVDVVLDGSRSMGIADGRKSELAIELAGFFLHSSRLEEGSAQLLVAGDTVVPTAFSQVAFTARDSALFSQPQRCTAQLRSRGLRVIVSDFMTLQSPETVLKQFAAQAAQLVAVMVLGPWEAAPTLDELWTLQDVEAAQVLSTHVNSGQQQRYLARLQQLKDRLRETCQRCGAIWVEVLADRQLTTVLKQDFLPLGIVTAAR